MSFGQKEVVEFPEMNVAYLSYKGNYMGNVEVFQDLYGRLMQWAESKGLLTPDATMMSVYYDDPEVTPPEELRLEVCLVVPDEIKADDTVKVQKLSGGKYAVLHAVVASTEQYIPAWEELIKWMETNGVGMDIGRPCFEICRNNPEEHPEGHHIVDICMCAV